MLDEVVDPDDVRVLHLGQELPFGHGHGHGVGVTDVEQALEHHPAVADVAVAGQVDPAQAAVGQGATPLLLPATQFARDQLGPERERGTAVAAEALGQPGPAVGAAADRLLAGAAETLVLRDLGVGQDRGGGVAGRDGRDFHQPGAQAAPGGAPAARPGPAGGRGPAAGLTVTAGLAVAPMAASTAGVARRAV